MYILRCLLLLKILLLYLLYLIKRFTLTRARDLSGAANRRRRRVVLCKLRPISICTLNRRRAHDITYKLTSLVYLNDIIILYCILTNVHIYISGDSFDSNQSF